MKAKNNSSVPGARWQGGRQQPRRTLGAILSLTDRVKAMEGPGPSEFSTICGTPWANTECVFVAILAAPDKCQALAQLERQGAVVSDAGERHVCCCGQELAFGLLQLL